MELLKYDETKKDWVVDSTKKNYSYKEQVGRTDTYSEATKEYGSSHWANARLNGNYYVWIPRYAYKIDNNVTYPSQSGESHKIDVKFISKDVTQTNIVEKLGAEYADYIVHPAFTFGTQDLSGLWVGKYETSGEETAPKIVPNVTSKRNINTLAMFNMAKRVVTEEQKANYDAHMMKNIEWGAVAYLTQSQYGRNGTEISVNQCSDYITGAGRGTDTNNPIYNSAYSVNTTTGLPETEQQYNGKIGKLSSTTGNIYGIYDLSGGANEHVAGCINGQENIKFGVTVGDYKYVDLYTNTTDTSTDYSGAKDGDATKETKSWNSDNANFVNSDSPVFVRGGDYNYAFNAGVLFFKNLGGYGYIAGGFRVCLAVNN